MLRKSIHLAVAASAALGLALLNSPASARGGGGGGSSHSGTSGPLHGPGSSHNPIVYHPVHGPGSTHNPILATKPVVRDHRNHGGAHGGAPSSEGGVTVTSGSGRNTVLVPAKLGDYPVYAIPGNGLYNGPPPSSPIVRDHR